MKRLITVLLVLSFVPFLVNASGVSVFFYIDLGSKDLVFAASEGVSHNAFADSIDYDPNALDPAIKAFDSYIEELGVQSAYYSFGPFMLYMESGAGFRPYRFSISPDADYFAIEFPWLLIPLGLAGLLYLRRSKASRQEND